MCIQETKDIISNLKFGYSASHLDNSTRSIIS
jgi:hypothetical protein